MMVDNKEKERFELHVNGEVAFATYRLADDKLFIQYVEAPEALRGTGAAGKLMTEIGEKAKAENLKIVPICSYAAAWLKRSKEYNNLVGIFE